MTKEEKQYEEEIIDKFSKAFMKLDYITNKVETFKVIDKNNGISLFRRIEPLLDSREDFYEKLLGVIQFDDLIADYSVRKDLIPYKELDTYSPAMDEGLLYRYIHSDVPERFTDKTFVRMPGKMESYDTIFAFFPKNKKVCYELRQIKDYRLSLDASLKILNKISCNKYKNFSEYSLIIFMYRPSGHKASYISYWARKSCYYKFYENKNVKHNPVLNFLFHNPLITHYYSDRPEIIKPKSKEIEESNLDEMIDEFIHKEYISGYPAKYAFRVYPERPDFLIILGYDY